MKRDLLPRFERIPSVGARPRVKTAPLQAWTTGITAALSLASRGFAYVFFSIPSNTARRATHRAGQSIIEHYRWLTLSLP
jgi:hypothetical protein